MVNPGVSGKVTLKLNEVPWDQALDLILKANGLGYTLEGNVIRIAPLTDLQNEEQQRRKLAGGARAGRRPGEPAPRGSPMRRRPSSPTCSRRRAPFPPAASSTSTRAPTRCIIKDLPAFIEKAKDLIADLDRPTRQVEIEARIVVTSRNFTRDLGIQWGFRTSRHAAASATPPA